MNIQYFPTQIDASGRFQEVPLETVEFETLDHCTVCLEGEKYLQDLAELKDSLTISRCTNCGHLFHRRRPTASWILSYYSTRWDNHDKSPFKRTLQKSRFVLSGVKGHFVGESVYKFAKEALPKSKKAKVLEVGCGYGRELIPFRLSGHSVRAIELSEHRARFVSSLGFKVKNIPIESLSGETFGHPFDLAYSKHVLEHVADPHVFIRQLTKVIRPGGWLALFVPNAESSFLLEDFLAAVHLQHFTESSLTHLLQQHGFNIHRLQKDHQLSVLARFEGKLSQGMPLSEQRALGFNQRTLFENILGPHYRDYEGKEYFCRWQEPLPRIRSATALEFSDYSNPQSKREIKLRWTGDESLPMRFQKFGDKPAALFWLK